MRSFSLWPNSWRELAHGLVVYGVPAAVLVSLCTLAAWAYKQRRSQLPRLPSTAQHQCSQQEASLLNTRGNGTPETEPTRAPKGGSEQMLSDSGYVDSPSSVSTSTPLPPNHISEETRSPECSYQAGPPQQQAQSMVSPVGGPTYSSAPVNLRTPRSRATILLPVDIIGRFIGRQGRNIKSLVAESGSQIHVQQKNLGRDATMVPCVLQGTNAQITKAIDIILLRHPEVVISPTTTILPHSPINPASDSNVTINNGDAPPIPIVHQLVPETSWDYELQPYVIPESPFLAIATYIEKLNRIWLVPYSSTQQLDELHQAMTQAYSEPKQQGVVIHSSSPTSTCVQPASGDSNTAASSDSSAIHTKDIVGRYCAVRVSAVYWLRGRVINTRNDKGVDYEVKLMDYGSSVIVPSHALKPLRKEHTLLNIQAFPCILANVVPINTGNDDGMVVLQALVEGTVLEVHISGSKPRSPDITPLAELYVHQYGSEVQAFVNREVVNQGFAVWRENMCTFVPEVLTSSASVVSNNETTSKAATSHDSHVTQDDAVPAEPVSNDKDMKL